MGTALGTSGSSASWKDWLRALRVHQWSKNVLVFVPLLTSFTFTDYSRALVVSLAALSFSLLASATYLINDIRDIEHDRKHARKQARAIPSGRISVRAALVAAIVLASAGVWLAFFVSPGFLLILGTYMAVTLAYSIVLKSLVLIDVLTLACLYTMRIIAGAAAVAVTISPWLMLFSVLLFLSLALVKRCSELKSMDAADSPSGRDYARRDLAVLMPLGVSSGLSAIIVFSLFISTLETQERYADPQLLWLVGGGLLYWIGRLWIKTGRGEMHDDPIVFAFRDRGSIVVVLGILTVTILAYFGVPVTLAQ